jgi:hypothetical protein
MLQNIFNHILFLPIPLSFFGEHLLHRPPPGWWIYDEPARITEFLIIQAFYRSGASIRWGYVE